MSRCTIIPFLSCTGYLPYFSCRLARSFLLASCSFGIKLGVKNILYMSVGFFLSWSLTEFQKIEALSSSEAIDIFNRQDLSVFLPNWNALWNVGVTPIYVWNTLDTVSMSCCFLADPSETSDSRTLWTIMLSFLLAFSFFSWMKEVTRSIAGLPGSWAEGEALGTFFHKNYQDLRVGLNWCEFISKILDSSFKRCYFFLCLFITQCE